MESSNYWDADLSDCKTQKDYEEIIIYTLNSDLEKFDIKYI